jgi:hypothetical protein
MTKGLISFSIVGAFLLIGCAPNGIIYKNQNYKHIKEPKAIYLFPLQSLTFDDTAKAFAKYFSKQNDTSFESYGSLKCSNNYRRLGTKCFNRNVIKSVDTSLSSRIGSLDSSAFEIHKVKNAKTDSMLIYRIPRKQILDSIGISCPYIFIVSEFKIYLTSYSVPMFVPFPGGAVAGNAGGLSFGIRGKYLIWDYANNQAIYAGIIATNFNTANINNKDEMNMDLLLAVYHLLNDTPFWNIQPSDL